MGVADWAGTLADWEGALEAFKGFLAPALGRAQTRASVGAFIDGLLSSTERKTGWMLAEQAGLDRPYRIQSLLGRSSWCADALRDRVRAYVQEALGDPDGVLVIDETGFLKKGVRTRWASPGNTPARPVASRTARSGSSRLMPAAMATPWLTAGSTCRKTGPKTPSAGLRLRYRVRCHSRLNPPWPGR
jgi:hypothetical protein